MLVLCCNRLCGYVYIRFCERAVTRAVNRMDAVTIPLSICILSPQDQCLCIIEWISDSDLEGCDAVLLGKKFPLFWRNMSPSYSWVHCSWYVPSKHQGLLTQQHIIVSQNTKSWVIPPWHLKKTHTHTHTMDLIQQPVRCVCTISRCFKNQKLQHSILCSVNCIIFMSFVEAVASDIRETSFTVHGEKEHQPLQQARPFQYSNTPYRWVNGWFSSVAWKFWYAMV